MKVLLINSVCGIGSTGRICADIARTLDAEGHEVRIAYGRSANVPENCRQYAVRIGTDLDVKIHGVLSRLFDMHGLGSRRATKAFLKWAEAYQPDLLWLHNLHGYYIHYPMLFAWIKKHPEMEVRWTLHDQWAFTGHCAFYLSLDECDKWKTQCGHCPMKREYPASILLDRSRKNFEKKKKTFTGVKNLTLITPSDWLRDLTRESILAEYPAKTVHNRIDQSVFRPTESGFRKQYGLEEKTVLLGVASVWEKRKGLADFHRLAQMLNETFQIVLVGLSQKQIEELPRNIIGIRRTQNVTELAAIYSAADWFINPTYGDIYPTVNLEAEACGTPVITYDSGGSRETIHDKRSVLVGPGDLERIADIVRNARKREKG